ncbi:phosphoglycerate kinase [Pelobium manganitolerans]|uniref:Phosphoglycerate kinase n=1 Tax=Pelobium manganitolerans TaxID=1842495 RepID=A0A419S2L8_9SPHI|nr:phosphoglycerate kinase [Pelobium manganitolerans]RKD13229.1 phosphoglycerate kinase [Pelobium manganitolerans]
MKTIDDINFSGKKALIRVDFNVPLDANYHITDDKRMTAAMPTLKKILKDGGSVILMSHLGRPKDGPTEKYSLKHIVPHLSELTGTKVEFADDCIGEEAKEKAANLPIGGVLLLENLRFYKEEEKGDKDFAQKLASLGDVYVNDAFGTAHRAHASTAVIADYFPNAKYFGYLMGAELSNAEKVLNAPERPFTAIMGGAKVSDKILLIERLMDKVDNILIGGGMTYTFVKANGGKIGKSLVEDDKLDLAKELIKKANEKGVKLLIPTDSVIADAFSNDAETGNAYNDHIKDNWMGLDIGEDTIKKFSEVIKKSKTILWNGPMGVFEMSKFENGTKAVANAVVEATKNGAFSLIGGGDSAAAVAKFGLEDEVSYVSTGGGALLEYMEGKELPGVKAILD